MNEFHQPGAVHHPARDRRHLRRRRLDALDRDRGRDGRSLERGGNAFDAAVATAFTLQVVEPHLNGPGGDVPVIVHDVPARQDRGDLRPGAGAGRAHHRALPRARPRPRSRAPGFSRRAFPAPSTPGCCCCATTARCGSPTCWRRRSAMPATAIRWSSAPSPPSPRSRSSSASIGRPRRRSICRAASVPTPGTLFTNPTLADTYLAHPAAKPRAAGGDRDAQIERRAAAWSQGFVAEAIDRFCRTQEVMDVPGRAASRRAHRPTTWRAGRRRVEAPLDYDYGRYTRSERRALGAGAGRPCSSSRCSRASTSTALDPTAPDFIHLLVEARKLAFADREAFYGDPKFVDVPVETLLSDAYNAERRKLIADQASLELRPGTIAGFGGVVHARASDGAARRSAPRAPASRRSAAWPAAGAVRGDTVHFDIIDRDGNMVSATPSGGWLQSSPVDPGARLLPRHARADVLARRGPSRRARARQAAAHDADADAGAARRRALPRLGLARRRPAGPVDHAVVPAPRPLPA